MGQVIGLPVTVGAMTSVCQEILRLARRGDGGLVCVANVHMLVEARRDGALRQVLERAALVVSDGMPLVWRLRRQGFAEARQVRGPDLMVRLCEGAAANGLPVYFYGGDQASMAGLVERAAAPAARAADRRRRGRPRCWPRSPSSTRRPPSGSARSGARLVFVGLGCPKQEFWMHAHRAHLDAVLVGVGQAFGIAAGTVPEAPVWMRRSGLEWLFRLASEPRRLWRRYLVTNTLFGAFLLGETAGRMVSGPLSR